MSMGYGGILTLNLTLISELHLDMGTWQGGTGPTCSNRTMCEESPPQKEKELSGYFFWFLVKGLADIRTRERSNFYTQYKNAYGDMGGF
jgi:molybdopterin biosynthesis enzyme MoaB